MIVAASVVGILGAVAVLVALVVLAVTAWRLVRAGVAARGVRDGRGDHVTVRRVRVQHRMSSRGYLEVTEPRGDVSWWPVYFHPELLALAPGATACRATWAGAGAFLVEPDILVLPASLPRARPRGRLVDAPALNADDLRERAEKFGSLRRRILLDAPAAAGAPIVGLLWVLVSGGGIWGFFAATVLAAIVAVWASAISGSDPS